MPFFEEMLHNELSKLWGHLLHLNRNLSLVEIKTSLDFTSPFMVGCQCIDLGCEANDFSNVFGFFFCFGLGDISEIVGHGLQITKESTPV